MTIGEKIKNLREEKGYTLEELGEKIGVGKSTVRKWENGMIKNMRRDKIAKLSEVLDCSPLYLLGYEDEIMPSKTLPFQDDNGASDRMNKFIDLYFRLDPSSQELVDNMIKALSEKQ